MGLKKVDLVIKAHIIGMLKTGNTSKKDIQSILNVSRTCIDQTEALYAETGSLEDRPRSGRPKVSTKYDDRRLVELSESNPNLSAEKLSLLWIVGSPMTVSRRLRNVGLN